MVQRRPGAFTGAGRAPPQAARKRSATRRSRAAPTAPAAADPKRSLVTPDLARVIEQLRGARGCAEGRRARAARRRPLSVTNLAQALLAEAEDDQGRPAPLLRRGLAVHPPGGRRSAAGDEAVSQRRRRPGVLPAAAREERPPAGVRIETLPTTSSQSASRTRDGSIGGSLTTLLYMTQIAAISQDPWFSRVQSPLDADYVAHRSRSRPTARRSRGARRRALGARRAGVAWRAGRSRRRPASSGLHIYIPLPPGTLVRSRAAVLPDRRDASSRTRHPKVATVERMVQGAPARHGLRRLPAEHPGQDAGDRLQRARQRLRRRVDAAQVEGDRRGVDPRDFTIPTAPQRFATVGDLWARLRTAKPANLEAVFEKYMKG